MNMGLPQAGCRRTRPLESRILGVNNRYLGDVDGSPEALLKACLEARDDAADLEGETRPDEALVAVAEWADPIMAEPDGDILGETAHRYATETYGELARDDS